MKSIAKVKTQRHIRQIPFGKMGPALGKIAYAGRAISLNTGTKSKESSAKRRMRKQSRKANRT